MGQVEPDRRQRDELVVQRLQVCAAHVAELLQFAVHPVIHIAARIRSAVEGFDESRLAHSRNGVTLHVLPREIRNVHVEQGVLRQAFFVDHLRKMSRDACPRFPVRILERVHRDGHARNAENRAFRCGRNRAGVDDADAGIRAEVYPADHEVGPLVEQGTDRQLDAICWRSAHSVAEETAVLEDLPGLDGIGEGDGVADGALFAAWRHDMDFAEILDRFVKSGDAGRVDAVVVAD